MTHNINIWKRFLSVIEKSRLKVRDRWLQFIKRVNSTNNKYVLKRAGILYDHKFEYNTQIFVTVGQAYK